MKKRHAGHPTVRVQEDSIKAAFLTVLNKLAYSERQRPQHRVVSRYIEMLSASQPGAVSVEDRETAALEEELKTVRLKMTKLAATMQAEGISARSIELTNELKDREQRILREMEGVDILYGSAGSDRLRQAAVELKSFIRKWTPTGKLSAYRDRDFLRFVEKAVVGRCDGVGRTGADWEEAKTYKITFHFICGLILTEEVGA